ncbi:CYCLOPS transcription factor [Parasponia andersonii]|uniref:CYCLOPS transcription factor n=1 Tax=Parasponia andersonii TaxID=3476 RepID=A0A2P5B7M0_PARAD|nr:CYCLOPS transcription factor [Parasponia andersonii]
MEGRGLSDLYRNSSEELFLRSYLESSMGTSAPSIDVLGFRNLSQNFRTDSEELFKSWLTNGENNSFNSPSITHRTRQASRRISTEITNLTGQQHVGLLQKKRSNDIIFPQNNSMADDIPVNVNQPSLRNAVEKGLQASELYLAKAWFHSSQPMTRSRSSELRRKYAAMQSTQTAVGLEGLHNASAHGINAVNQDYAYPNGFNGPSVCEMPNYLDTFMSPSNSSPTFNIQPVGEMDKVSSVVNMLKGTLERKKLNNLIEKEVLEDYSCNGTFAAQEVIINATFSQGQRNQIHAKPFTFQEVSPNQVKDCGAIQIVDGLMDLDLEGFVNTTNLIQSSRGSQEPSQSESSAAAPVVSSGFDACDGPSNSGQAISVSETSRKQSRNRSSENGSRAKDIREQIIGNLKDDRKRGSLDRNKSVTSAISVEKEDATKKRRVERSRKMAEAKERNLSPAFPSDMHSVLKRCETLEKEVRSLKLNLSFMNRKDSEQTKQIEELQKQNEDLLDEKECLIEEIRRVMSETGKI